MPFVQWKTQVDQHDLHTHIGWRSHRVELPLSIIVGCLPTLHPLYNRLACLQKRGSRKTPKANSDDSYALKEVRKGDSIMQTKDMYVDTSSMESRYEQYTWQIEDRVWGLIGHGKRGYGQAIDERILRVAHQASWRLRSGLEITALCFWIFVQIWIGFSAFMIYEFVFNTSDSSTFVISCKQSSGMSVPNVAASGKASVSWSYELGAMDKPTQRYENFSYEYWQPRRQGSLVPSLRPLQFSFLSSRAVLQISHHHNHHHNIQ